MSASVDKLENRPDSHQQHTIVVADELVDADRLVHHAAGRDGESARRDRAHDDDAAQGRPHHGGQAWPESPQLLDAVLSMVPAESESTRHSKLDGFLCISIDSPEGAAEAFIKWCELTRRDPRGWSRDERSHFITCSIAEIDRLLNDQVNAILHHPAFQRLEASWIGLRSLIEQIAPDFKESVKVRVLNLSWADLQRDLRRASEFDQSQLFHKVYEEEFGMPGGEPFGALIGDYEVTNSPDDVEMLEQIAGVAAAAFAPFIAAASPSLLDLERFSDLDRPFDLSRHFSQPQYARWRSLHESEDARFVGLTMPRILMRRPYEDDGRHGGVDESRPRVDRFRFREHVADVDARRYLWGNAAYAFGGVLIRAFQQTGWLADIRGVRRDELAGGVVDGAWLAHQSQRQQPTAPIHVGQALFTDSIITDELAHELAELGFMPLCDCQDTGEAAFYSVPSVQSPKVYDDDAATANAQLSAMLQHILCASRFAHYLKVIIRDSIGSFASADEIQNDLNRWIAGYVRDDDEAGMDVKARFPLRRGEVYVQPNPSDPSSYLCEMLLKPHYQLDALAATVRLTTETAARNAK